MLGLERFLQSNDYPASEIILTATYLLIRPASFTCWLLLACPFPLLSIFLHFPIDFLFADFTSADNGKVLGIEDGITTWVPQTGGGGGYRIGHGLLLDRETNTLSVNAVSDFEGDNTLPITAAAVQDTVGNIEILLGTI